MSNTHNWSIINMERRTSDAIVEKVHWKLDSSDGDNTVTAHGTTNHTISTDDPDYIPYDQLTEVDVLAWVYAEVSQTDVEADNDTHLLELSNPTASHGLPWES